MLIIYWAVIFGVAFLVFQLLARLLDPDAHGGFEAAAFFYTGVCGYIIVGAYCASKPEQSGLPALIGAVIGLSIAETVLWGPWVFRRIFKSKPAHAVSDPHD